MRNRRYFVMIAGLLALVIACSACDPGLPPVADPEPVEYVVQQEGTVHVQGDSVTWNTYWGTGLTSPFTSGHYTPGSTATNAPWGNEPANVEVPKAVAAGQVDTILWALGLNEISTQGAWTPYYQIIWTDILAQQVPSTSCVVMVKPHILDVNNSYPARPPAEMEALRTWIDQFAAENPNVVVVDWKPILEANPHFSATDGVHLVPGSGAAEARDAMYREGLAQCA